MFQLVHICRAGERVEITLFISENSSFFDLLGDPVGAGGPELGEHEDIHDDDEDHGQREWRHKEAHVEAKVAVLIDVKPTGVVA